MKNKTRAQRDAERLQELESAQALVDNGDASIEDVAASVEAGEPVVINEPSHERRDEPEHVDEPAPRGVDVSALEREIANLRRTVSHYEQEINPAQRRTQQLEREVETLRAQLEERAQAPAPDAALDYGLSEDEQEFDTVKSIAEKVSKAQANAINKKLLAEIDTLKTRLGQLDAKTEEDEIRARVDRHRSDLSKALSGENPDVLFSHPKIAAWATEQSEEEGLALRNPLAYSPKFVAGVLSRFKAEVLKGQAKREPSQGDLAVPSRIEPDVIERRGGANGAEPVFNPATFQEDVHRLIANKDTAGAEKLIAVAERAMSAQ